MRRHEYKPPAGGGLMACAVCGRPFGAVLHHRGQLPAPGEAVEPHAHVGDPAGPCGSCDRPLSDPVHANRAVQD